MEQENITVGFPNKEADPDKLNFDPQIFVELENLLKDKKRLDFVNSMGDGRFWEAHISKSNRGFVISNTDKINCLRNVRSAIDQAMKERGVL